MFVVKQYLFVVAVIRDGAGVVAAAFVVAGGVAAALVDVAVVDCPCF